MAMAYNEKKGHWPLMKAKIVASKDNAVHHIDSESSSNVVSHCDEKPFVGAAAREVREIIE